MKTSLVEEVLNGYAVEFGSRTYGLDTSITQMLCNPGRPKGMDLPLSSSGISISGPSLKLEVTKKSFKIFDEEKGGAPLARIDIEAHDGKPANHLQHGLSDYFDRHGDEAYDIIGEVFRLKTIIKMPWEK
ncbi:hypothetical protein HY643_02950 [Candidatus Woesearchaeota archaeon]|nr:hypothetical protein [Candidatus Woesearchaeota archaeon]